MAIKLDLIGIAVRDMAASLRFYRLLGLDIPASGDTEDHVEVAGDGIRLAWDTIDILKQVYADWTDAPVGHRVEIAFQCGSAEEVDTTYRRIVDQGYKSNKAPWDAFWGQRYAIVEDPDGNLISLFA
jgi:uncharacterized glyoxalase superfamily protein PhnB